MQVVYIETDEERDFVVLSPKWLCNEVIGGLLSHEQILHARPTGCFTLDDFQLMFTASEASDILPLLEALEICTRCEVDGDSEYEFPCLNFVETLDGLWEEDDQRIINPVYAGLRLQCPRGVTNQLVHLFPRVQVQLRRDAIHQHNTPDCDLYQWYQGSKLCNGHLECLVTLAHSQQAVEIKCRGPDDARSGLYYFLDDISSLVEDQLEDSCPGIPVEKYVLSSVDLKRHKASAHSYSPRDIMLTQLKRSETIQLNGNPPEQLAELLFMGCGEVQSTVTPGVDLHVSHLSIHTRRRVAAMLDPPDPMGKDWCLLAVSLGLTGDLPRLDQTEGANTSGVPVPSHTDWTLATWSRNPGATVGVLVSKLQELGRQDVADALLTSCTIYHIFQDSRSEEGSAGIAPTSQSTLSSTASRWFLSSHLSS